MNDSIKDNLVEVQKNIFISKSDPDFLRKYLLYRPTDNLKLYEYAKQLEGSGDTVKAIEYYAKAADNGNLRAKKVLEDIVRAKSVLEKTEGAKVVGEQEKKPKSKMLYILLLLLCLLSVGVFLFYAIGSLFTMNKNHTTNMYEYNSTTVNIEGYNRPTKAEELVFVSVHSAIEYYRDINGYYPNALWKLTRQTPENYLSNISSSFDYKITDEGYSLALKGLNADKSVLDGLINLVFYEKTNQLGVLKGEELLAIYDVASGRDEVPPNKTSVTKRVVNPNGGDGALGSRGLQLTENFAIHGTNEPESIGYKVSAGCLRMKNEDIEEIYPYIPLGTPFSVEKYGSPGEPTFKEGLSEHQGVAGKSLISETTPLEEYDWKE